jgi:SAM-dependent methyltransferase
VEQRKIWSHFQNRRPEVFSQTESRHRFLLDRLPAGRVINIGVGDGGLERMAAGQAQEMYSLDPDGEMVATIERLGVSRAAAGSIDAIPFGSSHFDAVVCSEVLEHLDDNVLVRGLTEIRRILRDGGELHGTVPADEDLQASEVVCPRCGEVFHRWGHMQSFSIDRLRKILEPVGEVRIERRIFVHWPSLNWKGRISASLGVALAALGSPRSGHHFYFVVKKHG